MRARRRPLKVGSVDEAHFHRWLTRSIPGRGLLPMGDDTAAIPTGKGRCLLLTTDALSEGWHFLPGSSPRSVGAAAASVSLSDLGAKGGRPIAFLLDLLLPPGTPERWAREVTMGAEAQLRRFGAHVVGGDTKPSRQRAVVGTLVGEARSAHLAPRTGARPGDRLVVTGAVGRGGHDALALRRSTPPRRIDLARILDLRPRVVEGVALAPFAHAMMDTSDGFADSVHFLASASGVRAIVSQDDLPIYPRLSRRHLPVAQHWRAAFFGGDYELLAALPEARVPTARRALQQRGCPLTVVGRIERGRGAWWDTPRGRFPLPRGAWRPFDPSSRPRTSP